MTVDKATSLRLLADELRGWLVTEGMTDDAIRKVWLMHRAAREIAALAGEVERLKDWQRTIENAPGEARAVAIERLADSEAIAPIIQVWREKVVAAESALSAMTARARKIRAALKPFADIGLVQDQDPNGIDAIDGPDLSINPRQVREARAAVKEAPDEG